MGKVHICVTHTLTQTITRGGGEDRRYSSPPLQRFSGAPGEVQAGGPGLVGSGSSSATVLEACGLLDVANFTEFGAATGLQLKVGTCMVQGAGTGLGARS